MFVKAIVPRGYCKGVVRAIQIAKEAVHLPGPVYILGMIVHNQYIVNALKELGVETIDRKGATRLELLDDIETGTIIITAHGAGDDVFQKAREKGLQIIDASCLDVIKTHHLIKEKIKQNKDILYIGKAGHPESEGAMAISQEHIHLITKKADIDALDPTLSYVMTNQTTMSLYDVYDLCEYAKKILPHVEIEQEICTATKIRQEAIKNIDDDVDIVFIVGDPHSHNTQKLASIAQENKEVYMIESVQDIDIHVLKGKKKAAVSSGASTPTFLTNQVISFLEQFDENDVTTHHKPSFNLTQIL